METKNRRGRKGQTTAKVAPTILLAHLRKHARQFAEELQLARNSVVVGRGECQNATFL